MGYEPDPYEAINGVIERSEAAEDLDDLVYFADDYDDDDDDDDDDWVGGLVDDDDLDGESEAPDSRPLLERFTDWLTR